jgi:RNA polymerase sigma factor (sigma-70 family)
VRWRHESPVDSIPDVADRGDFTDRQAVGAAVRSALAVLPRQQRAVLVLRYVEDLPGSQVASLLGVSAGTVKTHAHRGLRALRKSLGDLAPFPVNGAGDPMGVER